MEKTALIELSESHGECIYSQALFLSKKYSEIHLIIHNKLDDQTSFSLPGIKRKFILLGDSFFSRVKKYLEIRSYIISNGITTVVFNTTTGRKVQELLYFLPKDVNYFGSIHDGRKLVKSSTQKSISKKIKGYFVLNDYVKKYLEEKAVDSPPIQAFYPIFFPEFEKEELHKKENEFWIVIPGKLEQKRRNYFSIIDALVKTPLPANVKFILLGPSKHYNGDGIEFDRRISKYKLEDNFILFDSFISNNTYFNYIKNADLIMPAIEPGNEFYETYKHSQITGSYNLAFGFGIPLLYHEDLSMIADLKQFGIAYNNDNLIEIISNLLVNRNTMSELSSAIENEPKFLPDNQTEHYLEFLSNPEMIKKDSGN